MCAGVDRAIEFTAIVPKCRRQLLREMDKCATLVVLINFRHSSGIDLANSSSTQRLAGSAQVS